MQAKRLIFKNSTGDRAYICENSIVVEFGVCRNGISTSDLNGGYKKDFKTAYTLAFREALHYKLEQYIQAVPQGDFDKFLGEKSRSLQEQLSDTETLAVLKRLKDR